MAVDNALKRTAGGDVLHLSEGNTGPPRAGIGALEALYITDTSLGMLALIGSRNFDLDSADACGGVGGMQSGAGAAGAATSTREEPLGADLLDLSGSAGGLELSLGGLGLGFVDAFLDRLGSGFD